VLVAELEVRHSRPFAPTRRLAFGKLWLPAEKGIAAVLLAGIVAAGVSALEGDDEVLDKIEALLDDLGAGKRVVQPRVLYRFQSDVHGLDHSTHRLVRDAGGHLGLEIDGHGSVIPQILGALYAASKLTRAARPDAFRLLRRATRWTGGVDDRLIAFLTGDEAGTLRRRGEPNDERWALSILGFSNGAEPGRSDIQRRFRDLVRDAHPDHGAEVEGAGRRIVDLTEARRILLATA
jgi:hypothetical protein